MALEELLTKMITALEANTAALKGGKAPTTATTTATTGTTTTKKDTKPPGVTFEEVKVAATKVMADKGKPFAKKLISDVGGAKELAGVKPEKFGPLLKAFQAALAEEPEPEEEAAEDDEL